MASRSVFSRQRILALFVMIAFALPIILTTIETASADIPKPDGTPLLIITGKITKTNVGGEAQLDRKTLQLIGMEKLTTSNQFEPGVHTYEGVLLGNLLTFLGATGTRLIATALDGYSVEIPRHDAERYPVIIAMIRNGQPMTVRDRGPLWIIYPIDQFKELKDEKYSSRSIWQLNRIDVQ